MKSLLLVPAYVLTALLLVAGTCLAGAQDVNARERLLVVPFENIGRDGRLFWVSEGAATLLTGNFESARVGAVSREERLKTFERLQFPPAASLSQATIIRVAQIIGAAEVVMGSFTVADGEITVTARVLRLDSGRVRSTVTETGPLADFFAVFERLSRQLLPQGAVLPASAAADHGSLAVFENYMKGLVAETTAAQIRFPEAAVTLAPGFAPARIALWQVLTAQGDHARAVTAALGVPAGSREHHRAQFLVAWSRIQLNQYGEAFKGLKALLGVSATPAVFNNLGVIQTRRGSTPQTGRAAYYFTKAAEADPQDSDYAFNVGYAYWLDRDPKAATYWLLEAVRRNPADGDAHYVLGAALVATGSVVEGQREKELARQLSSTYLDWEARPNAAAEPVPKDLERLRDDLEASRLASAGPASAPANQANQKELAAFHADRGRRLFEQQRDVEAIPELRRSLYLLPYQSDVHLLLGRIYVRNGRAAEAIEALKISLWSQESSEGHAVLGQAYLQAKDEAGARAELQKARRLDASNPDVKDLAAKLGVKRQGVSPATRYNLRGR